jgi:phosphoadenosine phosphosulfate reductase
MDLFGYKEVTTNELIEASINLLKMMEQSALDRHEEGYYVANSFGKDSGLIKKLCQLAEVKFQDYHNQTTIDPPELIYFGRKHHSDCIVVSAKKNMFVRIEEKGLPTRQGRWCCSEYKERGGEGRVVVLGVRKAESKARMQRWTSVKKWGDKICINPIVDYTDKQVWEAHDILNIPYCSLYDEGFKRIGCVGCPLASKHKVDREFERWPKFREGWKRAAIRCWKKRQGKRNRFGELYSQNKFKSGEEYFYWWEHRKRAPDYNNCLFGMI